MKNNFFLIPVAFMLLLFSCTPDSGNTKTDLEKENLKGEVSLVVETSESSDDPTILIKEYNEQGFLTKDFYESSNFQRIIEYLYINNRLEKVTFEELYKGEEEKNIVTYYYNDLNQLIRQVPRDYSSDNGMREYFYDGDRLIKETSNVRYDDGDIGKERKDYFYSVRLDSMTYQSESSDISSVGKEIYNEWGQIERSFNKTEFLDDEGYSFSSSNQIEYDDNHYIRLFTSVFDSNGEVSESKTEYKYSFDSQGNWIKRVEIRTDEKESKEYITERKLYYRGDDFSEAIKPLDNFIMRNIGIAATSKSSNSQNNETPQQVERVDNYSESAPQYEEPRRSPCSYCKGTGSCPKCSVPQKVRYKKGEAPRDHLETRLGMIVCTQCGGNLMNWGADEDESCYLCKASGWLFCPECNSYGNGRNIGKCKWCDGTGYR